MLKIFGNLFRGGVESPIYTHMGDNDNEDEAIGEDKNEENNNYEDDLEDEQLGEDSVGW